MRKHLRGLADAADSEWVALVGGNPGTLVRVSHDPNLQLRIDIPSRLRFRIPLTQVPSPGAIGEYRSDVADTGTFRIYATGVGDDLAGTLESNNSTTTLAFSPIRTHDAQSFARFIGTYEEGARTLLVCVRGDDAAQVPFYAEGDAIVRLYPLGSERFVSELGEELEFIDPRTLTVSARGDTMRALHRVVPYEIREVTFASAGVELSGTLLVPLNQRCRGGIVLMHGSQPGERDFYRVFADCFVGAGVAALVFDKRGFGRSGGTRASSLLDRARDAAAAVRFLRGAEGIDGAPVGLWAFSNGTWSAPMVAAGMEDVAFLAMVGAAGVSPAEAETHRKLVELAEWGVPRHLLEIARSAWSLAYALVSGSPVVPGWEAQYEAIVERLAAAPEVARIPLAPYARDNPWLAPVPPRLPPGELAGHAGRVPEMAHDPVEDYIRVRCPVLFLTGSDDPNVPALESVARVRAALEASGNRAHEIAVLEGAAHFLNVIVAPPGGMSTAESSAELHAFRFAPLYLDRVTRWVVRQLPHG